MRMNVLYSICLLLVVRIIDAITEDSDTGLPPLNAFDLIAKQNKKLEEIKEQMKHVSTFGGPQADETNIIEGDMFIHRDEPKPRIAHIAARSDDSNPPLFNWHNKLWVTRVIPYEIQGSIAKSSKEILKSLQTIEKAIGRCLTFRRRRNSDTHWLSFYSGSGCFSGIGRKFWVTKAPTRISLGSGCSVESIIVHEVMHALGFPHEQSRRDRDSFVKIYSNRIISSQKSNFRMNDYMEINTMGTPYDYKSIMHYSPYSFAKDPSNGHTIEAKYDPQFPVGNFEMSELDVREMKLLYQCHRSSGYSDWIDSPCLCDWMNRCKKSKVRFCIGPDRSKCSGVNKYGTNSQSKKCTAAEFNAIKARKDGHWSSWGKYTLCSGNCGWGFQSRNRKCNNPVPASGGRKCVGRARETKICRLHRCSQSSVDEPFNTRSSKWKLNGFVVANGYLMSTSGPSEDHTREVNGRNGMFAAAMGMSDNLKQAKASLESPEIQSPKGDKCLMFHYMLNGENIGKNALSVYIKSTQGKTQWLNFPSISYHQGNYWKRAAFRIGSLNYRYKIVIEARFKMWRKSVVAIDDIFFDHNDCPPGLEVCLDKHGKNCNQRATKTGCKNRYTFGECCASCQNPGKGSDVTEGKTKGKCVDEKQTCKTWANAGECQKNKQWMTAHCCAACKNNKGGTRTGCVNKKESCTQWAKEGYCTKKENKQWMTANCCEACRDNGAVVTPESKNKNKCINKDKSCENWAKGGYCKIKANKQWMEDNCCEACTDLKATCKDGQSDCKDWAKKGECSKNKKWMAIHCCESCMDLKANCKDGQSGCKDWAKNGQCSKNKKWMSIHCCESCMGKA